MAGKLFSDIGQHPVNQKLPLLRRFLVEIAMIKIGNRAEIVLPFPLPQLIAGHCAHYAIGLALIRNTRSFNQLAADAVHPPRNPRGEMIYLDFVL